MAPIDLPAEPEVSEQAAVAHTETFEVTWYTAGPESTGKQPGDPGYGVTASGERVQAGKTIACPPEYDFGTVIAIEGVGERVCHDRGGHIGAGRLDVYVEDVGQARENGRQTLEAEVIE
ncbi:3D domain-containing protein [Salibacterium salarium]|uniref:3D domain-containing protein n=1 Tax=Salibacterium salarium TaxID=284579 RepID=UPI000F770958|nr:3D domain-containing protein [Salibacterium salarium]